MSGTIADLKGRVAVVTGAGRGIGRSHAHALARAGAAVVVNDIGTSLAGDGADPAVAEAVVAEIRSHGGDAISSTHDISSFAGAERLIGAAEQHYEQVDIVVNNAGIAADAPLAQLDEPLLAKLLHVHLFGAVGTARAAVPGMVARGHGRIVNTVSEAALDTRFPGGLAYGAAKAAVWAATLALARETAGTGVTVNALSPGARTRMNDALFEEIGEPTLDLDPDHVARVLVVLAGDDTADVTGRVIHAAAGQVREYEVSRSGDTPVARRLADAIENSLH